MAAKHISAEQLGLADGLARAEEAALFKWLVASFLFGKPIQQQIAEQAYRVIVEKNQRDTPRKLANCSKAELVGMLGQAHYVRYDNSTAERLIELGSTLNEDYGGKVGAIHAQSQNRTDFEQRLQAFTGIGPMTVQIFMHEAHKAFY